MQTVKTILHATDFSDLAANALYAALAIAQTYRARLILLYVKEPQEVIEGEFGMSSPVPDQADADIFVKLGELLPKNSTVQVERLVAHGMAAETIVQVAKEKHCDLIVLGTHGRKALARLFLGSVADSVIRSAPCPVLTLRSSQTEAEMPAPK